VIARLGRPLAVVLMAGPVLAGLAGTLLPAFGVLPALGGAEPGFGPFAALLAEPGLGRSVALSITTGLVSTALALAAVFLLVAGWEGTVTFRRLRRLVSPLLALPHAAAAFGLAFLIAPSGLIARLLSPELTGWTRPPDLLIVNDPLALAMTVGLAAKEAPFLLLMALAALPQLDLARSRHLATSFGYGRLAGFLHVAWPPLYRQIRLPVFAVLAFATSVVDVAAILGPTTPAPLAARLAAWMGDAEPAMRLKASAGAMLQLAVTLAALALWVGVERLGRVAALSLCRAGRRMRRDAVGRGLGLALMAGLAGAVALGLGAVALWSVAGHWPYPDAVPAELTLRAWREAAPQLAAPLGRSLAVGALAAILAVIVAMLCEWRGDQTQRPPPAWWSALLYLPLLVPQLAFLFGLQTALLGAGIPPGMATLVLVHLVFVLPYVVLSLSDPWRAQDRRYLQMALSLGRNRLVAYFAVKLPLLAPALATAAAVGFAVSVGLYLPTLIVGAGRLPTVTTEAVALAAGGNRRVIGVWALAQALLPALAFVIAAAVPRLIYRHRREGD